uniref:Uncharacterized protein MANES_12G014400 n=1 Tax=Rhizophora mucronata TaxID=61149 RepID=A0A2P2MMQ7_RHIMU
MYAAKQVSPLKSNFSFQRSLAASSGKYAFFPANRVPGSRVNPSGSIKAAISREDKAVKSAKSLEEVNGSLSTSVKNRGVIDLKAVITIRKKMKENISEKIEDQWEFFINGIGQGIVIQLISEEIDPG